MRSRWPASHMGGLVVVLGFALSSTLTAQQQSQNPSPMSESTRAHVRVAPAPFDGASITIDAGLPKPVTVFLLSEAPKNPDLPILLHFHGADFLVAHALQRTRLFRAALAIHLGAGSSVYERPFLNPKAFNLLLSAVDSLLTRSEIPVRRDLVLSSFSAGYGAVRALLQQPDAVEHIKAILLLDGLHTDYQPDRQPVAQGGKLNIEKLTPFVNYAQRAILGDRRLLITHSTIFPGTFASTTETADAILSQLEIQRKAILEWGPVGMQQLSVAGKGGFMLMGFAGNSAPDHVDHLHGLAAFLKLLMADGLK